MISLAFRLVFRFSLVVLREGRPRPDAAAGADRGCGDEVRPFLERTRRVSGVRSGRGRGGGRERAASVRGRDG